MEQRLTSKWSVAPALTPHHPRAGPRIADRGAAAGILFGQFAVVALTLVLVRPAFVTRDLDDLRTARVNTGLVVLMSAASVGATLWLHMNCGGRAG